ncbi:AbrB family transcriptional regulator [Tistrella mobilis]|uniref:AbrB family transcriptional regulator n=1 Tax=Tistrella mobilis TaxID=171437 RepID=UPI003558BA73
MSLPTLPLWLRWLLLPIVSVPVTAGLIWIQLPAALLLGPMVSGILLALGGIGLKMPRVTFVMAQSVLGCMIAGSVRPEILVTVAEDWPIFLGIVLSTILLSGALGWVIARNHILPGTTGVWGTSAGAASAMVVMAEAFGADARLVAFMQYTRVLFVAFAAALLAHFLLAGEAGAAAPIVWFPPIDPLAFAETLALAAAGVAAGRLIPVPAAGLLLPMIGGAVLSATGLLTIQLPQWLLAASYAVLAWSVGLGFTRAVLGHALKALPTILVSIAVLIGFCAGLAWVLTQLTGIDLLSAYLATSPGGLDTVAIIAASSRGVDIGFVMALQTMRFFLVVLLGPPLARFVARQVRE